MFPFAFSLLIIFDYSGDTIINFPSIVVKYLNLQVTGIDIHFLYYFFLICLTIFCFNSINIYAGVRGLESGQVLIIGASLIVENCICIIEKDSQYENFHSLLILGPFVATTLGLFIWNKSDRKTYVGDTFCYFAGCVLAAASIIGKYPIKLIFFFLP